MMKNKKLALLGTVLVLPLLVLGSTSCTYSYSQKVINEKGMDTVSVQATSLGDLYHYDLTIKSKSSYANEYFYPEMMLNTYEIEFESISTTFENELVGPGTSKTYRCHVNLPLPLYKDGKNSWYAVKYEGLKESKYYHEEFKVIGEKTVQFSAKKVDIGEEKLNYSYHTAVNFTYDDQDYSVLLKNLKKGTIEFKEKIDESKLSFKSATTVIRYDRFKEIKKKQFEIGRTMLLFVFLAIFIPGIIVFFVVFLPKILRSARIRKERKQNNN